MQAVILAAGKGTRLLPITRYVPKPLIPFWGRPFISYLLDQLVGLVDEVIIVDDPARDLERALGERWGDLPLHYVTQATPRGTGDAALQARSVVEEPFLLLLGDTCPTRATLEELIATPGAAVLTLIEVDDPENHLSISLDGDARVVELWSDASTVDAGVFKFDPMIFEMLDGLPPRGNELRVMQGVARLLEVGEKVRAVRMPGPWLQFGDHEGIAGVLRVMRELAAQQGRKCGPRDSCLMVPADGCTIENSLVFGPGSLKDCTIRDSVVYCAGEVVGATVIDAVAVVP